MKLVLSRELQGGLRHHGRLDFLPGRIYRGGHIIRWKEAVWEKRGPRQGRAVHIGDRLVTAEVIAEDAESGFVTLLVREDRILEDKTAKKTIRPLKKDERIRRKRATLERGRPERLLWSDESARAALAAEQEESATIKQSPQEKG
jgi:hypothetical protein